MESLVRKRSGKLVPFSRFRIVNAVFKAMKAVGIGAKEDAERIADAVSVQLYRSYFKKGDIPHVETIQDIIEKTLMEKGFPEVAKAYILYREKRREAREIGKALVDGINLIEEYLGQDDWRVKENSNMNYSLQGLNFHVSSSVVARYWLEKLYPQEVAQAHKEGDFHIHDLGSLSPYCVGWDLYDLLMRGFGGVYGKVESSPPKHFRSALGQIVNFFYTLQGESAGAQAFSNFDTLLAPFVRYDKLSYEEVKQCMQEFLFNVNVPTRVGFQTPFTNLTFDLKPSKLYRDVNIIIGGKPREEVYGEFHKEMSMINRAFCELMMAGDAKGRIFTFPIPTYNITKDFDWDNPDYEPLWEMTRKYGIPYFANFVNSDMDPDDARSMCLAGDEEILIKNSETIKRVTIKDVAEYYKASDFDKEGWAECKADGNLRVLSLNPSNFKLEWVGVKRFLKITDSRAVEIITEDGKKAIYSLKHPLPIYTPQGIKMKFAKDVLGGDILLVLKKTGEGILKEDYQKIGDYILDEDLAKILGFFIADGNYLFETRKNLRTYGKPRGLQFTFKADDEETIRIIKTLLQKKFGLRLTEKKDLRYNTYYIYVYNTHISRVFYEAGFKKYGRLPQVIFNSPKSVIQSFLDFFMRGDGYLKRKEIHLNDKELARDLVLLFSLIGQPVTYKERKNSQRIYLQHSKSLIKQTNYYLNNPLLSERVPGWTAQSTYKVPGLKKTRMVGLNTLDKYMAHTEESLKFKEGDVYPVRVKEVKILEFDEPKEFYDLELERNHLFIHSLGQVSFNCCRLRLDQRELRKRGGGLFGANPLTGCYDEETEVLTVSGWKKFSELTFDDELFTRTMDGKIEIHKPIRIFEYDWDGELIRINHKSFDLLVTPNHRMFVKRWNGKKWIYKFVEAKDFDPNRDRIPKQSIWEGEEREYFILPPVQIMSGSGPETKFSDSEIEEIRNLKKEGKTIYQIASEFNCNPVTIYNICTKENYGNRERVYEAPPLKIKMDDWLKLLGIWLSEGSTDNENIAPSHGYRVTITQKNEKIRKEIKELLNSLPFNYYEEGPNFVICNKQLWSYLRKFRNTYTKFIPKEIKNLSKRQLKILFDWMVKGDGYIRKSTGQIIYWTASDKLAEDFQEIVLKIGYISTIKKIKKTLKIKGKQVHSNGVWEISIQKSKDYRFRKHNIRKEYYKGKVYCVEVPNHIIMVRRNGKSTWCGNSIGVVTINLPRIGYLSTCEEEFFERLERLMELAKISLEIKRKVIEDFTEKGLYPYSKVYLQGVKEARGQYWANHFSTIGIVGMNECTLNFLGEPIYTKAGKEFALKVLKFMREKISDYQETTGNLYNLEATPAEGTSYRLARIDKKKFPRIKTQGTPEVPYYTNSVHLPVYYSDDIFEILTHQDELQIMFTGGTVVHLFVGEEITDRVVVKELVKAIVNRFRLPYFSITPTFSVCPVHGYIPGKHEICPFPHTEEELNRFGTEIVIPASLINKLSEGAVKISE
ncbi:anaerobic ribonucleoside-triphosphate reductase [Caldimicrobium thiodismutans]|uniref:Anaerobic ribonucleoside-triphosphate reductase n=1 Tax=Caldimicrobium thiodismutans TaxID=1653476 RepID=A0A0U4W241_9BACT|nr:ribonucleoside triphosphate reductase [Caldimicrobium thiodismutans]BAU23163.1 anaerobic ribonucleoside-triphosphate reductase [Caldimicrobium thiodismutans]